MDDHAPVAAQLLAHGDQHADARASAYLERMRACWSLPHRGPKIPAEGAELQFRRKGFAEEDDLFITDASGERRLIDGSTMPGPVVRVAVSPTARLIALEIYDPSEGELRTLVTEAAEGRVLAAILHGAPDPDVTWVDDQSLVYRAEGESVPPHRRAGLWRSWPLADDRDDELVLDASEHGGADLRLACSARRGEVSPRWVVEADHPDWATTRVLVADRLDRRSWRRVTTPYEGAWTAVGVARPRTLVARGDGPDGRGELGAIAWDQAGQTTWRPILEEATAPDSLRTAILTADGDRVAAVVGSVHGDRVTLVPTGSGPSHTLELPDHVSVTALVGDPATGDLTISYMSFWHPERTLRWQRSSQSLVLEQPHALEDQDGDFVTVFREVPGDDGAAIPLYLTGKRSVVESSRAEAPTVLSVYGGFGAGVRPTFRWMWRLWIEAGGLLASAGVRGGDEHGRHWHQQATGRAKPRTFDDVVCCGRYLRAAGWAGRDGPLVHGVSNGGLSAVAAGLRAPEAFAGVVAESAVLDVESYEELDRDGYRWVPEYGSMRDPSEAEAIREYSPVRRAASGARIPPTLLVYGAADQQVNPLHSERFAEAARQGGNLVIERQTPQAGHGPAKALEALCHERADVLAFASAACEGRLR